MAVAPFTDGFVSLNSVNLSNHVKEVTINQEFEDLDSTCMTMTRKAHEVGVGDDSFDIRFLQDWAAALVDQTLSPLVGSNTGFPFELRPTSAAVSTTNPKYTGTAKLLTYQPIAAEHGQLPQTTVHFVTAGITRATS